MVTRPRISVFPKCFFDELCQGKMDYLGWLAEAGTLGAEGAEHYDGFFASREREYIEKVRKVLDAGGLTSSLMCFSPDFTHPDPEERNREVGRQKGAIDLCVELGMKFCRTLSGQARPEVERDKGVRWTVEGIRRSLEYAEKRGIVLCMENHYKDGNWRYPEFAQDEHVFLEIIGQIDSPWFGVQYDPSNALVGGYDPLAFLDQMKERVVSVHASDRYLREGATLDDLSRADGSRGYSELLLHGETGRGMNDYEAIFARLAQVEFSGWISVEDGMNGLDELRRSVQFLQTMREKYFPSAEDAETEMQS